MENRVLLVDDDQALLNGLKRHFYRRFDLSTALGGEEALAVFREKAPISTVVVDMQMPKMNGVQLLEKIAAISPETTRIMLTGNADQQTAIDAVNQGKIFRFYNKPCDPNVLAEGIEAGFRQHELVRVEKELLENTLAGSVKMLLDILSAKEPIVFGRTMRVLDWMHRVIKGMRDVKSPWQLTLAATLFPIGNVVVPLNLSVRHMRGDALIPEEQVMIEQIPEQSAKLVEMIPRLAPVADIIRYHRRGFDGSGYPPTGPSGADLPLGSRILRILTDLADFVDEVEPEPSADAYQALRANLERYDAELLEVVESCLSGSLADHEGDTQTVEVPVSQFQAGHRLLQDLELVNGSLILKRGTKLSEMQVDRLRNFDQLLAFKEPIIVAVEGVEATEEEEE